MPRSRKYHDELMADLKDKKEAAAYLNQAFAESLYKGTPGLFQLALKDVIEAQGVGKITRRTNFTPARLNRALSPKKDLSLNEAGAILSGLGVRVEMRVGDPVTV